MSSVNDNQERLDLFAGLFGEAGDRLRTELARDPGLADELVSLVQRERAAALAANGSRPADDGIATLVGIGEEAGDDLGDAYLPVGVQQYDEMVPSDRISAIADL